VFASKGKLQHVSGIQRVRSQMRLTSSKTEVQITLPRHKQPFVISHDLLHLLLYVLVRYQMDHTKQLWCTLPNASNVISECFLLTKVKLCSRLGNKNKANSVPLTCSICSPIFVK
jgi:hypothetical protein